MVLLSLIKKTDFFDISKNVSFAFIGIYLSKYIQLLLLSSNFKYFLIIIF